MSGPTDVPDLEALVLETREGPLLRIRVTPRSRRRGVRGLIGSELSIGVGAPPEGGRATEEAIVLLAEWLGLPRSRLAISSGAAARSKRILVGGERVPILRARIARRLREKGR